MPRSYAHTPTPPHVCLHALHALHFASKIWSLSKLCQGDCSRQLVPATAGRILDAHRTGGSAGAHPTPKPK